LPHPPALIKEKSASAMVYVESQLSAVKTLRNGLQKKAHTITSCLFGFLLTILSNKIRKFPRKSIK